MTNTMLMGKRGAANLLIQFDEGKVASTSLRRMSLFYKAKTLGMCIFIVAWAGVVSAWTSTPLSKTVVARGETFTLSVSGTENYNWIAGALNADWITVSRVDAKTFTVTVAANASSDERSANVIINAFRADAVSNDQYSWVNSQGCTITQAGVGTSSGGTSEEIESNIVSPASIVVDENGCKTSIVVRVEGEWTVENNFDWVTVDCSSGSGNANVGVSVARNTTGIGRSGLIIIAGKGVPLHQSGHVDSCGVTDVIARQRYPYSGKVDIDYCIQGNVVRNAKDAGCLASLEVSAEDLQTGTRYVANEIVGDLSLSEGKHSIVWDMEKQGISIRSDQVVFSVSCKTNAPLYCIIDLSSGSSSTHYPLSYSNEIPGGKWSDEYRTTKLALRRIEPGSFVFGDDTNNIVTLTKAYYVSVFEMTYAQWSRIASESSSNNMEPVGLWYASIRGNDKGAQWPHSTTVDQDSLLGKLQTRTNEKFDLLTLAQWVYAYRSGMASWYYWGDQHAWCYSYGNYTYNVGTLLPNNWGLYDMSGNVSEWVLDRGPADYDGSFYELYAGLDPVGYDSTIMRDRYGNDRHFRIHMGGSTIDHRLVDPTSAIPLDYAKSDGSDRGRYMGVRLSLTLSQSSTGLSELNQNAVAVPVNTIETTHTPQIDADFSCDSVVVTMTWEDDWPIYYTCDGAEPTSSSVLYGEPFALARKGAKIIKAIAISPTGEKSEVSTLEIPAPNPPTISPADKTILTASTSVNIASDNPNATIYCTTDGSEPTTSSPVYKRFKASSKMTVKAIAVVEGMAWSETATAEYALGQCANPTITPADGTVFNNSNYQISIAKNGEKGVLRYTTDGSDPTETSPVYSGPFTISATTTIKAKVFDTDYFDSAVVSAMLTRQWTKVATPVVVAPASFSGTKQSVSLTCATEDAVIRYTTDGSEPNSHSKKYTAPFDVTTTTTIKAIALKTDCTTSDVATLTITKQWGIGDSLNDADRTFATDVGTGWLRDVAISHDGNESMRSGVLANSESMGIYSMSTLSTKVDGKGVVRFWWKASCEEDDGYEWDHGEFRIDGVTVARINGSKGWDDVSYEIMTSGAHTLSWVYCKDDFGGEGDDCIWLDEFSWLENDPIPDIGDNPTPQQIVAALEGSADAQLAQNITDGEMYDKYRAWAAKVKQVGGVNLAGTEAVKASPNAWVSFALGQDVLLNEAPADEDLTIEAFSPAVESGKFDFTVGVKDIEVGSDAVAENLKKVFGIDGGKSLQDLSSDNIDITFGAPVDGKVKFTAGPNAKNADAKTFFMKVKMTP